MATLVNDQFTGSNGAALDAGNWTVARATAGASATVQDNKGRWNAGSVIDYNGAISVRYAGADLADVEFATVTFTYVGTQDGRIEAWGRCDDPANPGTGYFLALFRTGTINLYRANAFAYTSIASASFSFTTGTAYKFRLRIVGTTVQAKVWLATDSEPGSWTMSVTDAVVGAAGKAMLHVQGGGDAGLTVDFDDVQITDGATGLTRVSGGAAISWDVRQRVSSSAAISWDVRQRVAGGAAISWEVQSGSLTRVFGTRAISWDVSQRVAGGQVIAWGVLQGAPVLQGAFVKRGGVLVPIPL